MGVSATGRQCFKYAGSQSNARRPDPVRAFQRDSPWRTERPLPKSGGDSKPPTRRRTSEQGRTRRSNPSHGERSLFRRRVLRTANVREPDLSTRPRLREFGGTRSRARMYSVEARPRLEARGEMVRRGSLNAWSTASIARRGDPGRQGRFIWGGGTGASDPHVPGAPREVSKFPTS